MAMIPKKVKTSKIAETGGNLEKMMLVLSVLILVDVVLSPHIHQSLSPLMYATIALSTLYLILPNDKNYGTSGYMRIIVMLRYYFNKLKEKVAKRS